MTSTCFDWHICTLSREYLRIIIGEVVKNLLVNLMSCHENVGTGTKVVSLVLAFYYQDC